MKKVIFSFGILALVGSFSSATSLAAVDTISLLPGESVILGAQRISCGGTPQPQTPVLSDLSFQVQARHVGCQQLASVLSQLRSLTSPELSISAACRNPNNDFDLQLNGTIRSLISHQSAVFEGVVPLDLESDSNAINGLNGTFVSSDGTINITSLPQGSRAASVRVTVYKF